MKKFIEHLACLHLCSEEIFASDDILDELDEDCTVVGTCRDSSKKLVVLLVKLRDDLKKKKEKMNGSPTFDQGNRSDEAIELRTLERMVETATAVLATDLCEDFPELLPYRLIGIYRGWKVAYLPPNQKKTQGDLDILVFEPDVLGRN